jgi:predicted ATPase
MTTETDESLDSSLPVARILQLQLTNFLSYRSAVLEFGDFVALVGPNASGKSNAVSAIKLLSEIPFHGLQTAIARRGGFDQLRHRSSGHPYNPALRLDFKYEDSKPSFYELRLSAQTGKRYSVKQERAVVHYGKMRYSFNNSDGEFTWQDTAPSGEILTSSPNVQPRFRVPRGQSAVSIASSLAAILVSQVLRSMQTVEINPSRVGELQEPSSIREFEPDGSNVASIFEYLGSRQRAELLNELAAIIPGIERVEVRRLADKVTLAFYQDTGKGTREFLAKQMSDGTLRAFSILLATLQDRRPALIVIEEPEIAIHLGALRTLVDILSQESEDAQILITTHSADIIDSLDMNSLRVVWSDLGASRISKVAPHTMEPVRKGLITPGELLRSDSLDAATA